MQNRILFLGQSPLEIPQLFLVGPCEFRENSSALFCCLARVERCWRYLVIIGSYSSRKSITVPCRTSCVSSFFLPRRRASECSSGVPVDLEAGIGLLQMRFQEIVWSYTLGMSGLMRSTRFAGFSVVDGGLTRV